MHLVVEYEPEPYKTLTEETVMGVDLGVNTPAAIHFRVNGKPLKWAMCVGNGRAMLSARGIIRREIIRLLQGLKRKDSPLQASANVAVRERLREIRKQEKRLTKTACQKIAAQIADQAKRNGAKIWQLEDLALLDMKEDQPWLARSWSVGMLIDAIKWQAKQVDAQLELINPRYTLQRCSNCGHIDVENQPKSKKGAAYFQCTNCSYKDHADKNAARNISTVAIDKIIEKSPK